MSKKKRKKPDLPECTDEEFEEVFAEVLKEVDEEIEQDWKEWEATYRQSESYLEWKNAKTFEERMAVLRKQCPEAVCGDLLILR